MRKAVLPIALLVCLASLCSAKRDCSTWTCYLWPPTNKYVPLRRNANGDIECLSRSGKDCLWRSLAKNCEKDIERESYGAKPHVCTEAEYQKEGHWCAVNQEECKGAPKPLREPPIPQRDCDQWACFLWPVNSKYTPIQRNDEGNIQCLGTSGKSCAWRSRLSDCTADLLEGRARKPLVCGEMFRELFGYTGYDLAGHWCAMNQEQCEGDIPVAMELVVWEGGGAAGEAA